MFLTLHSCSNVIEPFWYYWFNNRCVFRSSWCSVCINTFYSYTFCYTCELWFWLEVNCSIWIYSVCSFSWYYFFSCAIFECRRYFIINWEFRISFSKFHFTLLRFTLKVCSSFILSFWYYWSHSWSVSCFNFCSIFICRCYFRWVWCSSKVFIWLECDYSSFWI